MGLSSVYSKGLSLGNMCISSSIYEYHILSSSDNNNKLTI